MLSMTDYIERDVIQESEVEEPISEQQIMESFMALQVALAHVECMCEYQTIMEFCGEDIPSPVIYQEGDFADAFNQLLDNIVDWMSGIIRGIMQTFNRKHIRDAIATLTKDKRETYKFPENFRKSSIIIEVIFSYIDSFAEVLNDIQDGKLDNESDKKHIEVKLEGLSGVKCSNGEIKTVAFFKGFPGADKVKAAIDEGADKLTNKDDLIDELKKIHDLNIPVTGRKLLKRMEFDKNKTKVNGTVDKSINRKIRKCANNIAALYDGSINKFVDNLKNFYKENELKFESSNGSDKPFSETLRKRNFRDQTNPIGSHTPILRNNKS